MVLRSMLMQHMPCLNIEDLSDHQDHRFFNHDIAFNMADLVVLVIARLHASCSVLRGSQAVPYAVHSPP